MDLLQHIKVFKTNIRTKKDEQRIATLLSGEERIRKWNVARDDRDKVLRIVSGSMSEQEIIALVGSAGYCCEELTD